MSAKERPLSPFMIGPYYRVQLTSVLSMSHRITGVALFFLLIPLLLAWLASVAGGEESYLAFQGIFGHSLVKLAVLVVLFSLFFHLLNGIRHLFWDMGRGLEIGTAYASGWLVVAGSVIGTAILAGVLL